MQMFQSKSKKFVSIMAVFFAVLFGIMANGCGGGSSGGVVDDGIVPPPPVPTIEAPGEPLNFRVSASAVGGSLSATLAWDAPTTGGEVASYELYRYSSEVPTVSHLISLSADTYEFIDNAGLERGVTTYWKLSAKNAGGETFTYPVEYTPQGGGVGEVDTYGNNFAAAMIFADGIGISNQAITGEWTENNISSVDTSTGLRPTDTEIAATPLTEFPYYDPTTTYLKDGVTYYKQKTASTWQGEWIDGSTSLAEHNVTAAWGDNLISQTLTTESIVRIEMVLTKALDTNMTAYNMVSLYGEKDVEIYGTDKTTKSVDTAFVFTSDASLKIEQIDENNQTIAVVQPEQPLFSSVPDGPGKFGAEINVAGNLTYGYVWDLKQNTVDAGTYRITFTVGSGSNVIIGDVAVPTEGDPSTFPVLDSATSTHIDITIHQ